MAPAFSVLPSAPPAFSADGLSDFLVLSAIQETLKNGKTTGREGRRCTGKREKVRDALRYELIGAQKPR